MIAIDTFEISEPQVPCADHDGILAELDAFNRETFAIRAEAEAIKPQSEAFEKFGLELEALRKVGFETFNPAQLALIRQGIAGANEFRRHFEPRLNALLARQKAHLAHEKDLINRLRALGMLASEQPSPFGAN